MAIESRKQFSLWYFLVVIVLLIVAQLVLLRTSVEEIPYSEFKKLVREGKVTEVTVGEERIKGTYVTADGTQKAFFTIPIQDPDLVKELEASDVRFKGHIESKLSQALFYWILPLLGMIGIWVLIMRFAGQGGQAVMSFGKTRAKLYAETDTKTTFDDVAGCEEAKEELQEIIEFLKDPAKFQRLGAKIPKGVLLVGPPGTGKTLLARAVAGEAKVPFFTISGSDFVEMFVGVGAARVRDLFAQAKEKAPCIVFIDEIDAVGRVRGAGLGGGHDEREQTLNQLLVEMDGFESQKGVIIMAATNRPDVLDPALLRPGRFDRQIVIDVAGVKGRRDILAIHMRGKPVSSNVDLDRLARMTPGFSGADLANVVNEAALLAARRGSDEITMADFEEAIERVVAGPERRSRALSESEKRRVAYHEAGHAVVGYFTPRAGEVRKISIVPRGQAALGYTLQLPVEDRYIATKEELLDRITVFLGGRVAEEIVFGNTSTGSHDDLEKATNLARAMVCRYGMSDAVGPVIVGRDERNVFLGRDIVEREQNLSEETAQLIDKEIRRIVEECKEKARALLEARREKLDQLATELMEKEVLDAEEVKEILGGKGSSGNG